MLDAVVVGAGPNGLVAAIELARAGRSVQVFEAADTVGGGARTAELTLPGFRHDPCSAVHPLAIGSPALQAIPLADHGLEWIQPELALAHPMLDGSAAILTKDVEATASSLGPDGSTYRRLVAPFLGNWDAVARDALAPPLSHIPRNPLLLGQFGVRALPPASWLARLFKHDAGQLLIAGMAGHAIAPLSAPLTSAAAVIFAIAGHHGGWPIPRGGSQAISDALASYLSSLGGEIHTGQTITSMHELPDAQTYLFDTAPEDLIMIAGDRLPAGYVRRLRRFRHGGAVVKVDYALAAPVPWTAPECRRAGTVHVGASLAEVGSALKAVSAGRPPDPPFLITSQPSTFDPSRCPAGQHVFWVYAHAPRGYDGDLVPAIEAQLERFAPGFRDLVLARSVAKPGDIEARNRNYIGGDIAVGMFSGRQALFRIPYATGNPAIYLCSSATYPGPGVHGLCGHHAARRALARS